MARGNSREYAIVASLRKLGFVANRNARSGKRVSDSAKADGIAGDVIALSRNGQHGRNLLIEVGGVGKRVEASLLELEGMRLRDFQPMVCRFVKRKRIWYTRDVDGKAVRCDPPDGR